MNRKSLIASLIATLALACTVTTPLRAEDLKAKAAEAIQNFTMTDPGLTNFLAKAAGYAVLPSVGGGGFIIAGEHGDGLLFEKGKPTGTVKMTAISIGAQVGGGTFAEIIFFETADALNSFKQSKYEMSAAAKASVAASGVSTHAKYDQGVAVFTLPTAGASVGAAIGGQKFSYKPIK